MATPPLRDSIAAAQKHGSDPARCGYELCRHILLGVREARMVRPDLVYKYGSYLLQQHTSSLANEVWAFYEQVCISLLQHGRYASRSAAPAPGTAAQKAMATAQQYKETLDSRFPGSLRVKRLEGMLWEAKGEPDLALGEYEEILEADPSNLLATKRQVALLRSRGKVAEAAKQLVKYLETFCSDAEGWVLLHELYLLNQQYKRASFCIEELVLINPMNYIYHIRAAEITYALGMAERGGSHDLLLTARKYFAHALELKPENNLRALYGIVLVCAALGTSTKGKGTRVDTKELLDYVQPLLLKCYTPSKGPAHPMRAAVAAVLKKLTSGATTAASA